MEGEGHALSPVNSELCKLQHFQHRMFCDLNRISRSAEIGAVVYLNSVADAVGLNRPLKQLSISELIAIHHIYTRNTSGARKVGEVTREYSNR